MGMKKLLGLDQFPIGEVEIMRKMAEASLTKQEFVEFSSGKQKVRIHLKQMSQEGIMKDYEDYYIAH